MGLQDAYQDNHVSFEITDIEWEDDYIRTAGGEPPTESVRDVAGGSFTGEDFESLPYSDVPSDELTDRQSRILQNAIEDRQEEAEEQVEEFQELLNSIVFEYEAPAIAVDTSGRFVTHEIIGGSTVRQKVGEDPVEVTIDGVCKESTAKRLDNLRNAKYGTIISNRLANESLRVHFASTSTTPLEDSGAVGLTDDSGEFLYTYTLNCVEVVV